MTGCSGRRPPRDRLPQQLPQQGLVAVGVCPRICPHSGSAARAVHWRCARSRAARRQASGSGGYSSALAQAAQACVYSCSPAVARCSFAWTSGPAMPPALSALGSHRRCPCW